MGNYRKTTNQHIKKISVNNHSKNRPSDINTVLEQALFKSMDIGIAEIEEETKNLETPPPSRRHKIRMNRLFRERVGSSFLPFPEEDNLYERLRSTMIKKFKKCGSFQCREKKK